MNQSRRRFVGQCVAVVSTSAVSAVTGRMSAEAAQAQPLRNWAGNYEYSTNRITSATSLAQVQEFVRKHAHFKVLGTRHCFNGIADSADHFLSLREMKEVVALDRAARTVTVESGMSYGQLCPYLDRARLRAPQSGLAAAHLHRRRLRDRHAWLRREQRQPLDGRFGIRDRHGRRRRSGDRARKDPRDVPGAPWSILAPLASSPRSRWMCSRRSRCGRTCTWTCRWRKSGSTSKTSFRAGYSVSLFTDWQKERVNEVWVKRRVEKGEPLTAAPEFYGARAGHDERPPDRRALR